MSLRIRIFQLAVAVAALSSLASLGGAWLLVSPDVPERADYLRSFGLAAVTVVAAAGLIAWLASARLATPLERELAETFHNSQSRLRRSYTEAIEALVLAIDARDNDTTGHSFRVARYAVALGQRLGLSRHDLEILEWGALLHDIGKLAVPDAVLWKGGPLTEEEWLIMRQHPVWGAQILQHVEFLKPALDLVIHHQEQWNGCGYPAGLSTEEIPLMARIFSVVDTYDSLTSDRPYRRAASYEVAVRELKRVAGTQLDPTMVEAFLTIPEDELARLRLEAAVPPLELALPEGSAAEPELPRLGRTTRIARSRFAAAEATVSRSASYAPTATYG
jgi:putative nucleotidyltransferase with HDIG domain